MRDAGGRTSSLPGIAMNRFVKLMLSAAACLLAAPVLADDGAAAAATAAPYKVADGNKVDAQTLSGWKTWRALACERCHGAAQEGLVGPALVESLKTMSKEDFHTTIMNGRMEKGMPSFSGSEMVTKNWEGLYAYLKGRADGQIQPGRLTEIDAP